MIKCENAIVGGGIAGMSIALALIKNGQNVTLFEANGSAVQASIRNFGLIWPSGQRQGPMRDLAMHSRQLWLDTAPIAGYSIQPWGSMYMAETDAAADVLSWYEDMDKGESKPARLLTVKEATAINPAIKKDRVQQVLFCPSDACVQPVIACRQLEKYLQAHPLVDTKYHTRILYVDGNRLITAKGEYEAERIFVSSGHFFKDWYPDLFTKTKTKVCRLQMMRTVTQPDNWILGSNLCGDLTLLHYPAFVDAPTIEKVRQEAHLNWPLQMQHGIHILIAQHADGRITLGDSHHYDTDVSPFDETVVFQAILDYTQHIAQLPTLQLESTWQGVYSKSGDSLPIVEKIDEYTTFVGALGGAGMTLSMGLGDWVVNQRFAQGLNLSSERFEMSSSQV